jgi:iron(III) transport system ATP-binding protein
MRMADRIALMRTGKLLDVGEPGDLYRHPRSLFAARFFSEMNELSGTVRGGRVETPLGLFDAPGLAEGTAAVVCIRLPGVRLRPAGYCIPGRILARRSLGVVDLFEIVVSGLEAPILARVREGGDRAPGDDVGVEVDPAEVLVFAASEA